MLYFYSCVVLFLFLAGASLQLFCWACSSSLATANHGKLLSTRCFCWTCVLVLLMPPLSEELPCLCWRFVQHHLGSSGYSQVSGGAVGKVTVRVNEFWSACFTTTPYSTMRALKLITASYRRIVTRCSVPPRWNATWTEARTP